MPGQPGLFISIQGMSCCGLPGCKWHQRDARAYLGSSLVLHKVRRWVSCQTLFCGWVEIGAYAKRALNGGTYHPVCIQLAFRICIPRTLWVGKVSLKDGLEQPSSATGPSLLGSMGPRAGQVKTRMNYQVGLSLLRHGTKSTPTTYPPNKTPTPATTMVKSSLLRPITKQSTPWHHHPPWYHLLALA